MQDCEGCFDEAVRASVERASHNSPPTHTCKEGGDKNAEPRQEKTAPAASKHKSRHK